MKASSDNASLRAAKAHRRACATGKSAVIHSANGRQMKDAAVLKSLHKIGTCEFM